MARVLKGSSIFDGLDIDGTLIDLVPAAVIVSDADGLVKRWNRHAEELYGWTREEAIGRPIIDLVVPEPAVDEAVEIMQRLLRGERWEGEFPVKRKDGSVFLCHATDAAIFDADGAIVGMVAVTIDITHRARSARRLAARTAVTRTLSEPASVEEMIRKLLSTVGETLDWEVGAAWRIDAALARCIDVWSAPSVDASEFEGLTRSLALRRGEGFPGRVWADRVATWVPDLAEGLLFDRGQAAARIGLRTGFGFPLTVGDQTLGVMEFFTRQVEPPDDALLEAMSVIGSQIGQFLERKRAEQAAIRSEAVREALVEAALDCVISMDHQGNVVEFNPAAEATFGYDGQEVAGQPLADLIIPPEFRQRHREGLDRYLETGEGPILGRRMEFEGMRRDGSTFPVELTVIRVKDSDPPLFSAFLRDITRLKETDKALRTSRDQLEAIFQGVAEGITVQGLDGEIVYANDAAARTLGFDSVEQLLATPVARIMDGFEIRDEDGEFLPIAELPGRRALRGEAASRLVRFRRLPRGEERWSQIKATPVFDDLGRVRFAINIFHDITEQQRAQITQRFLAEASAALASSLDYDETLKQVARLAVPRLADWCDVTIREQDGSLRHLAAAHVDPHKVALAEDLAGRYPPDPNARAGVAEILRTGRSELYPEITDEMLEAAVMDDEELRIVRSLGRRSAMSVPMIARNRVIGVITLSSAESGRVYGPEDLRVAEDLAQRAALAVDNARLFRERSKVADALQQSLLPPQLPQIPRAEIAARYHAAGTGNEVGGDFYDAFPTGDGSWALVIGDVCGKGPEAAAMTGLARHTIRAAAIQERRPSGVLTTLNEAVAQQRTDHLFCTVCYVRLKLNPQAVRATVCCAGHPLPILMRAKGNVGVAGTPGTLLGIFPDPQLVDRAVDLGPGDVLVLYTDGVVEEQSNGIVFGRDRLMSLVESCAGLSAFEIAESIERAVLGFRPEPPRDDIALLVLRILP
jgi:PAS domain S-box-containing protein